MACTVAVIGRKSGDSTVLLHFVLCLVGLCSLGALKSYFSAPKRKNLGFSFSFSAPPRYGVRRPDNFFYPPNKISGPQFFFAPPQFFFGRSQRITQPDTWAPALGPQLIVTAHFRLPTHVILVLVRVSSIFILAFHHYLSACVSHVSLLTPYVSHDS